MKGFNEPELRPPPGGSGLKRETSPESLFSFAQNPLEEHRVVNKKGDVTKFIPTKRALPRIIWSGAEPFVL